MEELTSTVRQNAELARQADSEAHADGAAVRETEQAMAQMASVMGEIDQFLGTHLGNLHRYRRHRVPDPTSWR